MLRALVAMMAALLVVLGFAGCDEPHQKPPPKPGLWITPARKNAPTGLTKATPKATKAYVTFQNVDQICGSEDCGPYAAQLHWDLAAWGHTTTGYLVFLNGTQIADVASSPFVLGGLDCGTTFTLGVEAHDASSNHSTLATSDYTTPDCADATFPLQVSANGRYLEDASGNPFLLIGDSPQSGIGNLSESQMSSFLADRETNGFNALWENLLCSDYTYCNSDGTTYDGVAPFNTGSTPSDYDLSDPNDTYFARAHDDVAAAADDNIEVFLDPIETGGCVSGSWMDTLEGNGATKAFNYGVYVGNTFKDLNNIVWMEGNDFQCFTDSTDDNLVLQVAKGIASVDPDALQTLELNFCESGTQISCSGSASTDDTTHDWTSNVQLNGVYAYAPQYAETRSAYNASSSTPTFLVEGNYEAEHISGTDGCSTVRNCRLQEWWSMLSGGSGLFYGCECSTHYTNTSTTSDIDTTGVSELGNLTSLLSGVAWQDLVPDTNGSGHLITSGGGTCSTTGSVTSVNCITASKTADDTLALAYVPGPSGAQTFTVDLTKMAGSTTARWYDPTDGSFTAITGSPFSNSSSHSFTSPSSNSASDSDWVLVLQAS